MNQPIITSRTVRNLHGITSSHTPRGSKVTCGNCGITICEVVVDDAYSGTYPNAWSKIFGEWRVPEPQVGQALNTITCPSCGGRWIKDPIVTKGEEFLHFEGYGWWPGARNGAVRVIITEYNGLGGNGGDVVAGEPVAVRNVQPVYLNQTWKRTRPWWHRLLHKMGVM